MPNQKETLPRFQDLSKVTGVMRDGKVYAIPYAFDSIGLIYDTDKVKTPPNSWTALWDPQYAGKVLGYDNGEHNFTITALTMGIEDPYHLTDEQLQAAEKKLIDLKHNVLSFYTTADEALQLYQHNDVALIFANYGQQQVKTMQDAGAHIAYINPKEGAPAWLDTWAMTTASRTRTWPRPGSTSCCRRRSASSFPSAPASATRWCPSPAPARATSSSGSRTSRTRPSAPTCGTRSRRRPKLRA